MVERTIIDLAVKPDLKESIKQDFIKDKFPFFHKYKIKTKYGKEHTIKSFYYRASCKMHGHSMLITLFTSIKTAFSGITQRKISFYPIISYF